MLIYLILPYLIMPAILTNVHLRFKIIVIGNKYGITRNNK